MSNGADRHPPKCTVGTSTVERLPPSSAFINNTTSLSTDTHSPLSDALLLALRRSRPNTRLFRALFQYIPLRDSPNDNPHLELPLQAGDYILVHGHMDEDQFFFGETLNGQTGLVPSNYVERIPDYVLLQNASRAPSPIGLMTPTAPNTTAHHPPPPTILPTDSSLLNGQISSRPVSPSFTLSIPPHHLHITHDFTDSDSIPLPDSICPYPAVDVSKVTVQERRHPDQPRVPFPRELVVEKKLSRSAVFSWLPPDDQLTAVSQYHVCVDGVVKAVVPGTYKCKALIEDLALEKSVNISVRALTNHGHSADAACTLAVGVEAPVAPQHVRVTNITPISASLSWYPSNSNAEHVILLNALKVGVCPPAVFEVQLNGLSPSTIYRLSVRTKHPKAVLEQRPVERCVDFKTLPKIGLPDPPTGVQVEWGPQPGTLLVSWRPVTSQPRPPSRAAVAAYLLFADGRNIAQIPSATADHVLLRLADFADDPPIFITVRTKTKEGALSADSNVVRVPRGTVADSLRFSLPPKALPVGNPVAALPGADFDASQVVVPTTMNTSSGLLTTAPSAVPPTAAFAPTAAAFSSSALLPSSAFTQPFPQSLNFPTPPRRVSEFGQPAAALQLPQHPHKFLERSSTTALLPNGSKYTAFDYRQPLSQYYTFHPKTLYKDFPTAEEKPSVLEMENNYLLKHRYPQTRPHYDAERFDTYGRPLTSRVPMNRRHPSGLMTASQITPRIARVRSEEFLGTRSEPDLRPFEEECRWFVALYDYDYHMSPNPNAQQEELSFFKHQLIKVYGDVDADGFYRGQIGRRYGLVPSNMVIEIARDDLLSQQRKLPNTTDSEYPSAAGAISDTMARRMRWGSTKSRSYDNAGDRRPHLPPPERQFGYSSLDRRDYHYGSGGGGSSRYYDFPENPQYPTIRAGAAYAPKYRDYRYERSSSYEPRPPRFQDPQPRRENRQRQPPEDYRQQQQHPVEYSDKYPQAPGGRPQDYGRSFEQREWKDSTATEPPIPQQQQQQPPSNRQLQHQQSSLQQQQQQIQQPVDERFAMTDSVPTKKMMAKYDYDSRQLSPNVDAEQVELSFRLGDVITVFGEMDEDGFYMGELNGVRGLVPSNFLQEITGNSLTAGSLPIGQPNAIVRKPSNSQIPVEPQRPKGVMFSDAADKAPPNRQISQTSVSKVPIVGVPQAAPTANSKPKVPSANTPSLPSKANANKKAPDAKSNATAARKASQAAKKETPKKK